jgi:hypothetical protein
VLKAVTRGSKTGRASTAEAVALLKTGLAAWLEGEPFSRIEASLGVPAATQRAWRFARFIG